MSSQDNITKAAGSNQGSSSKSTPDSLSANVGREFKTNVTSTKVGEGLYADLHDNFQSGITESTTGVATFQVKANLGSFQLESKIPYGTVIFSYPIDAALSDMSASIANQYVNYRITHLSVTVRNVSPFASASGSVQFAYINDPNNIVKQDAQNIETLIRQTNSRQVGAKDTLDLDFNQTQLNVLGAPSGWKFCKPRGVAILDRYGTVAAAVRGVPAIGDGAQFVVSVAATFEFFGMTLNLPDSETFEGLPDTGLKAGIAIQDARYADEFGDYELKIQVPATLPPGCAINESYTCYFASSLGFNVEITDSQSRVINFPCTVRTCTATFQSEGLVSYKFIARTARMANLNRPYEKVVVTPSLNNSTKTAILVVPSSDTQLINEESIDIGCKNEIRMFESLCRHVDARLLAAGIGSSS